MTSLINEWLPPVILAQICSFAAQEEVQLPLDQQGQKFDVSGLARNGK